jgi:hypothetical protein
MPPSTKTFDLTWRHSICITSLSEKLRTFAQPPWVGAQFFAPLFPRSANEFESRIFHVSAFCGFQTSLFFILCCPLSAFLRAPFYQIKSREKNVYCPGARTEGTGQPAAGSVLVFRGFL